MLVTTPQTISIALGAGLIALTGYRALLIAMAGIMSLAAGYLLTRTERRRGVSTPELREPLAKAAATRSR
jgi:hypothetical protein